MHLWLPSQEVEVEVVLEVVVEVEVVLEVVVEVGACATPGVGRCTQAAETASGRKAA